MVHMYSIGRQCGVTEAIQDVVAVAVDIHVNLDAVDVLCENVPDVSRFNLGERLVSWVVQSARVTGDAEGVEVDVEIAIGIDAVASCADVWVERSCCAPEAFL